MLTVMIPVIIDVLVPWPLNNDVSRTLLVVGFYRKSTLAILLIDRCYRSSRRCCDVPLPLSQAACSQIDVLSAHMLNSHAPLLRSSLGLGQTMKWSYLQDWFPNSLFRKRFGTVHYTKVTILWELWLYYWGDHKQGFFSNCNWKQILIIGRHNLMMFT